MAQPLTAPPSAILLPSKPDYGKESNAMDATRINADKGSGAPFATVLKTTSENNQVRPDKSTTSSSDSSALATSITANTFLTSLRAGASLKPQPQQTLIDAAAGSVNQIVVEPAVTSVPAALLDASQSHENSVDEQPIALINEIASSDEPLLPAPLVEISPVRFAKSDTEPSLSSDETTSKLTEEQQSKLALQIAADPQQATPTAAPAGLINAVPPAPTFSFSKTSKAAPGAQKAFITNSADFTHQGGLTADKFAAKAAIAAESGRSLETSFTKESGSGDFSAAMDRGTQSSSLIASISPGLAASEASSPGLKLETPLGHPGWRDEFGQKLTWMVSNTRQQADLILNPPHLGRIEVTLTLDGDKANASFFSPHANVREALENSLVRLREVLADAGVTLGQTHVGEDSRQHSNLMNPKHDGHSPERRSGESYFSAIDTAVSGGPKSISIGRGMVDIFA